MKRRLFLCAFCWLFPRLAGAAPSADLPHDPAWQEIFRRLTPLQDRQCAFEERRYFAFRHQPITLSGVARLAPGRGLSLEYLTPQPRIVIVDQQGLLWREGGSQSAAPADPHVQAATGAMAAVMRFDPVELARDFSWRGTRQGDSWRLALTPHDPAVAESLGSIVVSGAQGRLAEIELVTSPSQRIEIRLGPPLPDVAFAPETLAHYFR
jgi:hypothetical protein